AIEVTVDSEGIAPLGPLEHHVFEEVRHAGQFRRLIAGAGPHPEPNRNGPGRGIRLANDLKPVRQCLVMKLHSPTPAMPRAVNIHTFNASEPRVTIVNRSGGTRWRCSTTVRGDSASTAVCISCKLLTRLR